MIPGYVRCWHRDAKEAVKTDEDGLDCDINVTSSHSLLLLCYADPDISSYVHSRKT